jgi:hypothetical protein
MFEGKTVDIENISMYQPELADAILNIKETNEVYTYDHKDLDFIKDLINDRMYHCQSELQQHIDTAERNGNFIYYRVDDEIRHFSIPVYEMMLKWITSLMDRCQITASDLNQGIVQQALRQLFYEVRYGIYVNNDDKSVDEKFTILSDLMIICSPYSQNC